MSQSTNVREQAAQGAAAEADHSTGAEPLRVDTRRRRARKAGKRVSVALSPVAYARLQHRAEVRGLTMSAVAAEAIQSDLERPQSEQSEAPPVRPDRSSR
jgi:hypothetical protein